VSAGDVSYIHGYSDDEANRLVTQAEYLAPWVFDGVHLDGARVLLEVGMGVGAETRLIRRRWPELRVVGVDISEHQLRHARHLLMEDLSSGMVTIARASGTSLPFADGSADAGFICWLLEHVPDPVAILRECVRVLRPGARVFVTEVYDTSLTIEPRQPAIEKYWAAFCDLQQRAGGHPNIGARLGVYAARAGLEVVSHRFVPVLGDGRDRGKRKAQLEYFRELLRSAAPQLLRAGMYSPAGLEEVWRAFDAVDADEDSLICYTMAKLEGRVAR
jgi:ubiquinone/menaquinone biosynthesis C-methylase UbiE